MASCALQEERCYRLVPLVIMCLLEVWLLVCESRMRLIHIVIVVSCGRELLSVAVAVVTVDVFVLLVSFLILTEVHVGMSRTMSIVLGSYGASTLIEVAMDHFCLLKLICAFEATRVF